MTEVPTWAGLDVRAASTVACVMDAQSGEMSVRRLPGRTSEVGGYQSPTSFRPRRHPGALPRPRDRHGRRRRSHVNPAAAQVVRRGRATRDRA